MIRRTELSEEQFVRIMDGEMAYYGGSQTWFPRYTQGFGGCGPAAAANILAYMAMTDPECTDLYPYDAECFIKSEFTAFMELVCGALPALKEGLGQDQPMAVSHKSF